MFRLEQQVNNIENVRFSNCNYEDGKRLEENNSNINNHKNDKVFSLKRPLINFSNVNNFTNKPNLKDIIPDSPKKRRDFINLDKATKNKSLSFNEKREAEKITKSSEKYVSSTLVSPSNTHLLILLINILKLK